MTQSQPNLFEALFTFHPREGHTPKENFLTESFAYLLRTDDDVRSRWLSNLVGRAIDGVVCEVFTRQSEKEAETTVFPDLLLEGQFSKDERFAIYCEHKWDSPCNREQLRRYCNVAAGKGNHAFVVFVCANIAQRTAAEKCFTGGFCRCFLWEDVFNVLETISSKSVALKEFLDFMKSHGLSPTPPLTVERMAAFLHASDFLKSLLNFANKLNVDYSWDFVPRRFHAANYVHDAYGRVGIRFETKDWRPALTVGFLYDESDHKVTLVNRDRGIDLLLRIEAEPTDTKNIDAAAAVFEKKRTSLQRTAASVLVKGERGNGNPYSVLIVRECLGDVIERADTASQQLGAIHMRLTTWLRVLFDDGTLEKAFKKCRLDSGM